MPPEIAQQPVAMDRLQRANELLRLYGEAVRHFFKLRTTLVSPMFNLPGRLVLGSYCYYEHLPALLEELLKIASPEDIGRSMRRLAARPNAIHLHSLMLGFFNGREQAILRGTARSEDPSQIMRLIDFWDRVARTSRSDGMRIPDENNFSLPSLSDADAASLAAQLPPNPSAEMKAKLRKMTATLELYTFILNGEARIGAFHHGPYRLDNGDVLIVKELTGFRDIFYPWQRSTPLLPVDGVVRVRRYRGLQARIFSLGGIMTDPNDEESCLIAEQVLAVAGNQLRAVLLDEAVDLTARAAESQMALYRVMMEWDDRYRVAYGAELYGNILKLMAEPFKEVETFGEKIRTAFAASVERHLDGLVTGAEPPLVLQHIAKTGGPVYTPLRA